MATLSRNLRLDIQLHDADRVNKQPRLTKIICTIGPKTKSKEMLNKLMDAGMCVARLNFSHGTHEYHGEVIDNVKAVLADRKLEPGHCSIMLDTKGPEIRTGKLKDHKPVPLKVGQQIDVTTDLSAVGDEKLVVIDYQDLCESVHPGGVILIADGNISLTINSIEKEKKICHCTVNNSAVLGENKNVHLPGAKVTLPALSEKDKADLLFGVEKGVDSVAASFIRTGSDVRHIREVLGEKGKDIKIISKIESTEGLENFDDILAESDGIMVARGDLGVELPLEQIFIAQKMMISKCNAAGKPVITATQMLESMIQNPRPTRAEATDVANAVLDGSDCVMLSGETASGEFPVEAVEYMDRISRQAEQVERAGDYPQLFEALKEASQAAKSGNQVPEVVASYAVRVANDLKADLLLTISETGKTSRLICKYRPRVPVICLTNSPATANYMIYARAAVPYLVSSVKGTEHLITEAMARAKKEGLVKSGSLVVVCSGIVEGIPGSTNSLRVVTVA
jgi:pyruvate kinase